MARDRKWGLICPDDGGICYDHPDWGDRVWCPSNEHGGNGKFFNAAQLKEGWSVASTGSGSGLTESQIRALKGAAQDDVDAAEAGEAEAPKGRAPKAPKEGKPKRESKPPKERTPVACECGCGEMTKGGRFIPGHDARLHSRWNAQAKALGYANWKEGQAAGVAFDTPEVVAKAEAAAAAKAEQAKA